MAIDVVPTLLVDVAAEGERLPLRPGIFDVAIATGVFEYFPEPRVAAKEIHRVLKPGGVLIMSVAAVCPRATDEEHWRYLPAGLRFVLSDFSNGGDRARGLEHRRLFQNQQLVSQHSRENSFLRTILHYTFVPIMNLAGNALQRAFPINNDQLTGNYSVLARK